MTKAEYIRALHDIAYTANMADADVDIRPAFLKPEMAHSHVNPALEMIKSLITREQYHRFLDFFGDIDGFLATTDI